MSLNRRIVLHERPDGLPGPAHFRRDDVALLPLEDACIRVRNRYLSIDPAQRGWVNAGSNYSTAVGIGDVMRSLAVGIVEESRDSRFHAGEALYGWFGWQDCCDARADQVLTRVDPAKGPLSLGAGVYGITGLTAWLALMEVGQPKPGETVLVSTAAGAVGSIVGQLARELGCRVVGLTGSEEKVRRCVEEFGYDVAINYRPGIDVGRLRAACGGGADVYFDNTSGPIADSAWQVLRSGARIVQCGTASIASWEPPPQGPRRDRDILVKRLRHQGFIIFDHAARYAEVVPELAKRVASGALRFREDISDGLDSAPQALADLYRGDNDGKRLVRL